MQTIVPLCFGIVTLAAFLPFLLSVKGPAWTNDPCPAFVFYPVHLYGTHSFEWSFCLLYCTSKETILGCFQQNTFCQISLWIAFLPSHFVVHNCGSDTPRPDICGKGIIGNIPELSEYIKSMREASTHRERRHKISLPLFFFVAHSHSRPWVSE